VLALLRDRAPASVRVLEAAALLTEVKDGLLTVICPPDLAGEDGFEQWLADRLAAYALRIEIELAPPDLPALHSRIAELDCRLLVVAAAAAEDDAVRLRELSERTACDLLFVQ